MIIDDAYWDFSTNVDGPVERLKSATLTIPYPWVDTEPVNIRLVTSTGVTFDHVIDVATETPAVDGRFLLTFALIGIYIGLIPVLIGLTWKPFLATLSRRWLNFFLAFTAGVLIFLAFETLDDAVEEAAGLPSAFGGIGIVVLGAALAFVATFLIGRAFRGRPGTDPALVTAFTVAAGIGVHNLGEGLAVGAAYRLGEIALGTFLVIGFAIHNTTEGLGIVSILGKRKVSIGPVDAARRRGRASDGARGLGRSVLLLPHPGDCVPGRGSRCHRPGRVRGAGCGETLRGRPHLGGGTGRYRSRHCRDVPDRRVRCRMKKLAPALPLLFLLAACGGGASGSPRTNDPR